MRDIQNVTLPPSRPTGKFNLCHMAWGIEPVALPQRSLAYLSTPHPLMIIALVFGRRIRYLLMLRTSLPTWRSAMTFRPGVSGNPHGNRHRTRHLLNQEFMQALLLHFRQHGKKAIEKVAREQPASYLKILGLLVPREHKVEHSNPIKDLTDEQLEAMIEYIKTSLEAQAGGSVRVIEGMIEPTTVPATALPVLEPPKRKPNLMIEVDTAIGPQERKPRKRVPSPASS